MTYLVLDNYYIDSVVKNWIAQHGIKPSKAYIDALNNLAIGLRSDGNLALLDRLWIFSTEQQTQARVSIVNPTSAALTENNAPTWTAKQGYTGNGSTMYLDMNYTPSVHGSNYTQNSSCIFIYNRTSRAANANIEMGCNDGTRVSNVRARFTADFIRGTHNSGSAVNASATISDSAGFTSIVRDASANVKFFKNGAQVGTTVANVSTGLPTNDFFVFASNNSGTAGNFSSDQISIVGIGGGGINQATLYTRIQTFATAIGFNV